VYTYPVFIKVCESSKYFGFTICFVNIAWLQNVVDLLYKEICTEQLYACHHKEDMEMWTNQSAIGAAATTVAPNVGATHLFRIGNDIHFMDDINDKTMHDLVKVLK